MIQGNATRRKFLVASVAFSGLMSTGMGATLLRAGSVWAQSSGGNADELARIARLLFPHDGVALNDAQGGDWFGAGEDAQIAAMKAVENEAFFAAIHGNVQARFYSHAKVWEHIKYPGSSVEFGGYVDRGFDDIDWLPEDA
jgi:hypothetical protein